MRKKVKWETFTGIVILLLLAGILFQMPFTYEGKVRFDTVDEYTTFKEAMAEDHVRIDNIEALSSEPPIIIGFSVQVPRSQTFPYGARDYFTGQFIFIVVMGGLGLGLIIIPFMSKPKEKTVSEEE